MSSVTTANLPGFPQQPTNTASNVAGNAASSSEANNAPKLKRAQLPLLVADEPNITRPGEAPEGVESEKDASGRLCVLKLPHAWLWACGPGTENEIDQLMAWRDLCAAFDPEGTKTANVVVRALSRTTREEVPQTQLRLWKPSQLASGHVWKVRIGIGSRMGPERNIDLQNEAGPTTNAPAPQHAAPVQLGAASTGTSGNAESMMMMMMGKLMDRVFTPQPDPVEQLIRLQQLQSKQQQENPLETAKQLLGLERAKLEYARETGASVRTERDEEPRGVVREVIAGLGQLVQGWRAAGAADSTRQALQRASAPEERAQPAPALPAATQSHAEPPQHEQAAGSTETQAAGTQGQPEPLPPHYVFSPDEETVRAGLLDMLGGMSDKKEADALRKLLMHTSGKALAAVLVGVHQKKRARTIAANVFRAVDEWCDDAHLERVRDAFDALVNWTARAPEDFARLCGLLGLDVVATGEAIAHTAALFPPPDEDEDWDEEEEEEEHEEQKHEEKKEAATPLVVLGPAGEKEVHAPGDLLKPANAAGATPEKKKRESKKKPPREEARAGASDK